VDTDDASPVAISFRLLARSDIPALTRWLNMPHVYAWWGEGSGRTWLGGPGDGAATVDMVADEYGSAFDGSEPNDHFVIVVHGQPVGLIQWYRLAEEPEYAHDIGEPLDGTAGIDLLIGDPSVVGRGIGPGVIDTFVRTIVFAAPDVHRAIASPDPANARSIRAFEKAGFTVVRDAWVDDGHRIERVMVRDRVGPDGERPGSPGR
jgi:RimJ/RimL family protein N-acetyltransferase